MPPIYDNFIRRARLAVRDLESHKESPLFLRAWRWRKAILMSDFRRLNETILVSPQLTPDDVANAAEAGVRAIINNRPDNESPDQTPGDDIAEAARAAGLTYTAIPVDARGFNPEQVSAMSEAITSAQGPVLAYCRSGTRSTLLWALSEAQRGGDPESIAECARAAGYDIAPVRALVESLATSG